MKRPSTALSVLLLAVISMFVLSGCATPAAAQTSTQIGRAHV